MFLTFKKSLPLDDAYIGLIEVHLAKGETEKTIEVDDTIGKTLIDKFPNNFVKGEKPAAKQEKGAPNDKEVKGAPKDKSK